MPMFQNKFIQIEYVSNEKAMVCILLQYEHNEVE